MADYLAELESSFNKLNFMGLPVAEEMQMTFLLVLLMNDEIIPGTVAAFKTMNDFSSSCEELLGHS